MVGWELQPGGNHGVTGPTHRGCLLVVGVLGLDGGGRPPGPPLLTFNYAVCPASHTINFRPAATWQLMEGLLRARAPEHN